VGKDVLDIACGTGYGSKMLLDASAKSAKGMDLSQVAIDHANKEYASGLLEFSIGDAENLLTIKKYF
jgi:ubiquinone/menaquinone biosynthesis C-methylase UbiE